MPIRHQRPDLSRGAFFCLLIALAAAPARADAPSATLAVAAHDTQVVRGRPVGGPVFAAGPAAVTVVRPDRARGTPDLAELLEQVAGLQIRRWGGLGAPALPSVRGSSAGQIAVLVDGLPLSDAQDGAVDLSSLPLDRYERVEVYRGAAPARFGGAGAAGALNLVTRTGAAARRASWLQWAGAHGEAGLRVEGGDRAAHVILHARRADNRFAFRNHNQTFGNPGDDFDDVRRNAWFREGGALLTGAWERGGWRARLAAGALRRDAGRPGPVGGYESPHADLRLDRYDLRLSLSDRGGALALDLDARRSDERLRDEGSEVGWDPPGTTDSRGDHLGGRLSWRFDGAAADARWSGRLGAEWRRQRFDWRHADLADPRRERRTVGAFAGASLAWPGPRLTLSPAWRWQRLEDDFPPVPAWPGLPEEPLAAPHVHEKPSPSLGVAWDALPGRLLVEAHWAAAYRAPTWVELFGHRGGVDGNRELRPEELVTRDVSVFWRPSPATRLRLAWFATEVEQGILWVRNSQFTSRAANTGRTRATGLEAEGVADLGRWGRGWANLTVLDAVDRGDDPIYAGKALPYLPDLAASAGWELDRGDWSWGVRWLHESASYRDRYNSEPDRTPARSLVHLTVSRVWHGDHVLGGDAARLTCELLNLGDDDTYDVEGFPLPGRTARVSLIFH